MNLTLGKLPEKKDKLIYLISYIMIFLVFSGTDFLKFNIVGINFNMAKIFMLIPVIILAIDIIRHRKLILNLNNRLLKYCIVFLVIWAIYSVITIYRSYDFNSYLIENFFLCIGIVDILFFIKYINITENKNTIFLLTIFALLMNCIYYIYLYYIKKINIGGFYHNTNDLATALILGIFMLINLIINIKGIKRVWLFSCLAIFLFTFFSISSRACILGIIFGCFLYLILNIIRYRKKIFRKKLFIIITVIIIIACVILGIFVLNKYLGKISFSPVEDARASNEIRMNLIFNGLEFLNKDLNWITGIGAGNSEFYLRNFSIYSIYEMYSFHNPILQITVTYAILITIGFIISYFIYLLLLYKIDNNLKGIAWVFLVFLLSLIVANISSSGLFTREWIWITFAIIIAFINKEIKKEQVK